MNTNYSKVIKFCFYILLIALSVTLSVIFLAAFLEIFIFRGKGADTGPIGDTFGGLLSPLVGIISIFYIYKTFKTQRDQFLETLRVQKLQFEASQDSLRDQLLEQKGANKVQEEQFKISRINEIIYNQLNEINNIASRLSIEIPDSSTRKNTKYNGQLSLLSLNKFISSEEIKVAYTPDHRTEINTVIASNLENLAEIYEILSSSVVIISELLDLSGLSDLQKSNLQKLFLLNLSRSLRDNPFKIRKYLSPTNPHPSDLANEYSINLSELEQLVDISVNFFSKTVNLNESIRGETIADTEAEQFEIDNKKILRLLDVVALLADLPADKVQAGQVGTIVEQLADGVFEVEFADKQGRTIAMCAVEAGKLLKLTYDYPIY